MLKQKYVAGTLYAVINVHISYSSAWTIPYNMVKRYYGN